MCPYSSQTILSRICQTLKIRYDPSRSNKIRQDPKRSDENRSQTVEIDPDNLCESVSVVNCKEMWTVKARHVKNLLGTVKILQESVANRWDQSRTIILLWRIRSYRGNGQVVFKYLVTFQIRINKTSFNFQEWIGKSGNKIRNSKKSLRRIRGFWVRQGARKLVLTLIIRMT